MAITHRMVAVGPGWRVTDVVCNAGPSDRPYEEQHGDACIALVTRGTFEYRTVSGSAMLTPGALLLGNRCDCFECRHEHAVGDRSLAFHYTPALFEDIGAGTGKGAVGFIRPVLPAGTIAPALLAEAEAESAHGGASAMEDVAMRLASAVMAAANDGGTGRACGPNRRDIKRVTDVVRWIEANADAVLPLTLLAERVGMSVYHFLRCFRGATGLTPHQYVLRLRLHRAALRLRTSRDTITHIALETGFGDLSTFNHRFRRLMGMTPGAYRAACRRQRLTLASSPR